MLKFWRPVLGQRGAKWRRKSECFVTGTMTLFSLCNGRDRHEIRPKKLIGVLCWTLIEEFWQFSLKGVICPQTAILGLFWRVSVSGVTFFDLAKPSIYYRKGQRCANPNRLFVRLAVSAVEARKVTQISIRMLGNYNGMIAYICRRFLPSTAFVVSFYIWLISRSR